VRVRGVPNERDPSKFISNTCDGRTFILDS
jgi:hypothetical protein